MRSSHWPLAIALVLGMALPAERADACFAPAFKAPKQVKLKPGESPPLPANLLLGTTTVVLTWDGKRQTTTLIPEVSGDLKKFSLLIPVAGRVTKKDLKVLTDEVHYQLLDATRPRLELTQDPNPCGAPAGEGLPALAEAAQAPAAKMATGGAPSAAAYGVKVEGHFEVGEYDLALLSAKSAKGLGRWLRRFKYQVSPSVEKSLGEYLGRGMKILVARVHLKKLRAQQFTTLRPLQIRFRNSGQPTLPLAIAAASGETADIVVLALGPDRMDLATHRMLELPTGMELPAHVADDWDAAYLRIADHWLEKNGGTRGALLEFAGPSPVMNLKSLGAKPGSFLTRWRVRISPNSPDLVLAAAPAPALYRVGFTARAPWHGAPTCKVGRAYMRTLPRLLDEQATSYASLSGVSSEETLATLRAQFPQAFKPWPEPRREKKEIKLIENASDEDGGFFGSWWKIALGLLGLVVSLVVVGRVQRG